MKKYWFLVIGFLLGVIVTFLLLPEFAISTHIVDMPVQRVLSDTRKEVYTVTHIVDGDTIDVTGADGKKQRVRFIGIDTPETVDPRKPVQCEGPEASARMKELLSEKTVTLEAKPDEDKDQYNRLLRYVFLDGNDIGAQMIEEGYAVSICEKFPHEKCSLYEELEQKARQQKLGRWSACAT